MKTIILTGYSGAGKSVALRFIEERGYYCVDNLPAQLLLNFIAIAKTNGLTKVAVVIDARGHGFMKSLAAQLATLKKKQGTQVVFFDADLPTITKRFKEHRLRHPLALTGTIQEGFAKEQAILAALRQHADLVLDTSAQSATSLKNLIQKYVLHENKKNFEVHLQSFGFKYGIPQEADVVIDVRLLVNPFFEPHLKNKTGKNSDVQDYINKDSEAKDFLTKTAAYVTYLVKMYEIKERPFFTVAFGCTGGKHRSVFIVEKMKLILQELGKKVRTAHRDMKLGT